MTESTQILDALDRRVQRRDERREFFRAALGMGALAAGGAAALSFSKVADAQSTPAITDTDILNFALNLEYLEAQFYYYAAFGRGLPATLTASGTGAAGGTVTGGQAATLTDRTVIQYAREIAQDEAAHVAFLRTALGSAAVAQPAIDISGSATGAFTAAARAAGVVASTATFNPYADDNSFLLGAYIFEDVGVTAYKGASPLITNVDFLDAAAGILAAEAFHAGLIRGALYRRGVDTAALITNATRISDARDTLDGVSTASGPPAQVNDDDQGIAGASTTITYQATLPVGTTAGTTGTSAGTAANIVPTDTNGVTFSRSPAQVLNIVYLNRAAATMGGFFPAGVNGTIRASAAN